MTRRHRGYPYPAHGRCILYPVTPEIPEWWGEFWLWQDDMQGALTKFCDEMSNLATAIADVMNPFFAYLNEWWKSLPPELKAAIADAAEARQEQEKNQ